MQLRTPVGGYGLSLLLPMEFPRVRKALPSPDATLRLGIDVYNTEEGSVANITGADTAVLPDEGSPTQIRAGLPNFIQLFQKEASWIVVDKGNLINVFFPEGVSCCMKLAGSVECNSRHSRDRAQVRVFALSNLLETSDIARALLKISVDPKLRIRYGVRGLSGTGQSVGFSVQDRVGSSVIKESGVGVDFGTQEFP